jgi:ubiquinone/menaquinone biosynthesis C-methylase UbiE
LPLWLIIVIVIAVAVLAVSIWWRTHPSACPYSQRFWVQAPHPFINRRRLREVMAPREGERVLEVGPGTGYYTMDLAEWVGDEGSVEIFDLQEEMLDHTMKRAQARGLGNIEPTQGDARKLPYPDDSFDAALLVTVLGEIPEPELALRELKRVLKPSGRLIVGELFGDPHMVRLGVLQELAESAGLGFDLRSGPRFGYFARLVA